MYKLSDPEQPVNVSIGVMYAGVIGVLLTLVAVHQVTRIPFANFTADPAAMFDYNPLFGSISHLGILLWGACASVCFLSAAVLNIHRNQKTNIAFLVNFGALTVVLMLDDLFMFHESIAPWYLSIPEKMVLAVYGLYAVGCFYHFRRTIMVSDTKFLILSIVTLGMSIVIDQISSRYYIPGEYLLEDGLKFIGIASWLAYFLKFSFGKIMGMITPVEVHYKTIDKRAKTGLMHRVNFN